MALASHLWNISVVIIVLYFCDGILSQIILPKSNQTQLDEPDFQCPAEQGFYPHPIHCEKYYGCWNYKVSRITCPRMQVFDMKYSGCNWAELTNCQDRLRPEGFPAPIGGGTTAKPFDCPYDVEDALYPDPNDCYSYYRCVHGTSYHQNCPPKLMFNEKTGLCDYERNVNCKVS